MKKRTKVLITEPDFSRLRSLLESARRFFRHDQEHLVALEEELNRAEVIAPQELPAGVVTMDSRIRVTDLGTGAQTVYTLSFPHDADIEHDRISVLAPIGTFLLGCREGAVVEVQVPRGKKRLRIDKVISANRKIAV